MRKFVSVAGLAALLSIAAPCVSAQAHTASKTGSGTIVITFKDGHKQTYNLSDIARVEFPTAAVSTESSASSALVPPRGHFIGKWEVGEGNGDTFYITLLENGDALRSLGNEHGKWVYIDGEARVTWNDGAQDAIRKVGSKHQKAAHSQGKSFTDAPDNVTDAHNTTPHSI